MNTLSQFQPQAARSVAESDEYYPSIDLNARWRVIECRDSLQWILQTRNRAETVARDVWRGRSYCRNRDALIRCCDRYAGPADSASVAALKALPAWFHFHATDIAGMEAHHAG